MIFFLISLIPPNELIFNVDIIELNAVYRVDITTDTIHHAGTYYVWYSWVSSREPIYLETKVGEMSEIIMIYSGHNGMMEVRDWRHENIPGLPERHNGLWHQYFTSKGKKIHIIGRTYVKNATFYDKESEQRKILPEQFRNKIPNVNN